MAAAPPTDMPLRSVEADGAVAMPPAPVVAPPTSWAGRAWGKIRTAASSTTAVHAPCAARRLVTCIGVISFTRLRIGCLRSTVRSSIPPDRSWGNVRLRPLPGRLGRRLLAADQPEIIGSDALAVLDCENGLRRDASGGLAGDYSGKRAHGLSAFILRLVNSGLVPFRHRRSGVDAVGAGGRRSEKEPRDRNQAAGTPCSQSPHRVPPAAARQIAVGIEAGLGQSIRSPPAP